MLTIPQLRSEVERLHKIAIQATTELQNAQRQLQKAESLNFIEVNGIKKEDVQASHGDGIPWFNIVTDFGRWMTDTKCTKAWAEWNGIIYRSEDLKNNRMPATAGRSEDLK